MITMPIEVYTDGSCLKNPGVGGYGYIIRYYLNPKNPTEIPVASEIEANQGYRLTTNNRMEVMGIIQAMRRIIDLIKDGTFQGAAQINLFADSSYASDAINKGWLDKWSQNNWMTSGYKGSKPQPVKNKDLWEQINELRDDVRRLGLIWVIQHVDGHSGHEYNERADKLAVAASNSNTYIIDEGYERTM